MESTVSKQTQSKMLKIALILAVLPAIILAGRITISPCK